MSSLKGLRKAEEVNFRANFSFFTSLSAAKAHVFRVTFNVFSYGLRFEVLFFSCSGSFHTQDTASANKAAKRTIRLIERRQKLIKLADKSEAGWLAVDEYESDELADDSADEKRIRKAQDKAVRKKFQMAKSASRSRSTGSSIRNVPSNSQDNLLFRGL